MNEGDGPTIVEVTSEDDGRNQPSDDERDEMLADPNGDTIDQADNGDVVEKMFHRNLQDVKKEQVRDPDSVTGLLRSHRNGTDKKYGDMEIEVDETTTMAKNVDAEIDDQVVKPSTSLIERLVSSSCLHFVVLAVVLLFVFLLVIIGVRTIIGDDVLLDNDSTVDPHAGRRHVETITHCGRVEGIVQDRSLVFYGIPYSAPPVGPLRWKPSELVQRLEDCWTEDVYKAHNPKPMCYQKPLAKPFEKAQFSEDCLYLDVYTPRVTYNDPMPVVVYFAGDSFQGHDVTDFQWRPSSKLAREKETVFVVVYYRMNAFGFLALELLTRNVHPPTSGNYGVHDMLTALKWVHRNVDSFGGDPAKVTLLGSGSSATGIVTLLSSRLARLLFNQAWITGGSTDVVNKTLREVERNNEAFNRHLMCDTTECLYNKTSEQILNAIPVTEWPFWGVPNHLELPTNDEHMAAIAVVDGAVLYDIPSVVWENNDFVDVALVIGSSLQSVASKLLDEDLEDFDWSRFNATVKSRLGTFGADVVSDALKHYYGGIVDDDDDGDKEDDDDDDGDGDDKELEARTTPLEAYVTMLSDLRVTCPLLGLAYKASKVFTNNVYFYLSTYVPDGSVNYVKLSEKRMAAHGLDVAAIFDILPSVMTNPTAADLAYQRTIQEMFYSFVERGRPSTRRTSSDKINPKMPWTLNYVSDMLDSSTERYANCDLWTRHGMYPRHGRVN